MSGMLRSRTTRSNGVSESRSIASSPLAACVNDETRRAAAGTRRPCRASPCCRRRRGPRPRPASAGEPSVLRAGHVNGSGVGTKLRAAPHRRSRRVDGREFVARGDLAWIPSASNRTAPLHPSPPVPRLDGRRQRARGWSCASAASAMAYDFRVFSEAERRRRGPRDRPAARCADPRLADARAHRIELCPVPPRQARARSRCRS